MSLNYPLEWPLGLARTAHRGKSRFDVRSLVYALDNLCDQLRMLGARDIRITTNVRVTLNHRPARDAQNAHDPAVAAYFVMKGQNYVLTCDRWDSVRDNMHAIAKHVEALRGQNRWGCGSVEQAFAGYKALPDASAAPPEPWWEVLGLTRGACEDEIRVTARVLLGRYHPDAPTGDREQFEKVTRAREEGLKAVGA